MCLRLIQQRAETFADSMALMRKLPQGHLIKSTYFEKLPLY